MAIHQAAGDEVHVVSAIGRGRIGTVEAEVRVVSDVADGIDEELAAKLDVKSQAQAKVAQVKDAATTDEGKPRPEVLAGAGAVAAALVAGIVAVAVVVVQQVEGNLLQPLIMGKGLKLHPW